MGATVSARRSDELLRHVRALQRPEDALLSEDALGFVPALLAQRGPETVEDEEGAQEGEAEEGAEEPPEDSEGADTCRVVARLAGRRQNAAPMLFGKLLFARRMEVLEHIQLVLLEKKAKPGGDPFFTALHSPVQTAAPPQEADALDGEEGGRPGDMSLRILSNLCSSALTALQSLGNDVAQPVVSGLREMMMAQYPGLEVGSLSSSSLDDTMDFLLLSYDEHRNMDALEALCILATGRGSVYYLLQLALRLFRDGELTARLRPTLLVFLEKCALEGAKEEQVTNGEQRPGRRRKLLRMRRRVTGDASVDAARRAAARESTGTAEGEGEGEGEEEEEEEDDEDEDEELVSSAVEDIILPSTGLLDDLVAKDGLVRVDGDGIVFRKSKALQSLLSLKITQVSCSENHVLVLCGGGDAYAFGDNTYGQCGVASGSSVDTPARVETKETFRAVAAGGMHSLFLSDDSAKLLTCGRNQWGQLGQGHMSTQSSPACIKLVSQEPIRITAIAAATYHSAYVVEEKAVYGFGQLQGRATVEPTLLFCCEATSSVVALASGPGYCVALEESGGPNGSASVSPGSVLSSLKKRRKRRRRKVQFKLVTCIVEEQGGAGMEARVFHAQTAVRLVASRDHVLALVDEPEQPTATSNTVPPSPRSGVLHDLERLTAYNAEEPGVAAVLWGVEKLPVASASHKFENTRILLHVLEKLADMPTLMIPALRVLQRHCFVSSSLRDDGQVTMHDMKQFLFTLADSHNQEIKAEAIRAIGNGFAFLSPTATELATFMSTITNMTYLSRFATLKFWSELLAQEQQDTALILIERLVDLATADPDNAEVLNLILAMQRSLLLAAHVEHAAINKYATALATASVRVLEEAEVSSGGDPEQVLATLDGSVFHKLMRPCVMMLHHPAVDVRESVDPLVGLLTAVDRLNASLRLRDHHWLAEMQWGLVFLLLNKVCGEAGAGAGAGAGAATAAGVGAAVTGVGSPTAAAAVGTGGATAAGATAVVAGAAAAATAASGEAGGPGTSGAVALDGTGVALGSPSLGTVPAAAAALAAGEPGTQVNQSIFNSGFCEPAQYEARLDRFRQVVADEEHEVMNKVSKMNKMKFRNKQGADRVWAALRAVYAAIRIFDAENVKTDAHNSAMKILRWINQTKQALEDADYDVIGDHVVQRAAFLLKMIRVSEHSLFQFVQQYDHSQLQAYEAEYLRQREHSLREARGFELFSRMLALVRVPDVRRHVIFCFTEFANAAKITPRTRALIDRAVDAMIERSVSDPELSGNAALCAAVLDACVSTGHLNNHRLVSWLVSTIELDPAAPSAAPATPPSPAGPASPRLGSTAPAGGSTRLLEVGPSAVSRDPQSLAFLPSPQGLPASLGVQWSREHKHPVLRLSKNGLCFQLPLDAPARSCRTAAGIRLAYALHSGKAYFQLECTPSPGCPPSSMLYAIGLVGQHYSEWDGFSRLLGCSLAAEHHVGLYVDMDVGEMMLFRHKNRFYADADSGCFLEQDSLLTRRKLPAKSKMLYPAVCLLSAGTTSLLKQVVVESDVVRITLDSAIADEDAGQITLTTVPSTASLSSLASGASGTNGSQQQHQHQQHDQHQQAGEQHPDILQTQTHGSLLAPSRGVAAPASLIGNQNPEQDDEEDDAGGKRGTVISGPLNLGLADETELLVCGQNTYGELGVGDLKPHKDVTVSSTVEGLFPVQVVAGNELTGVVTSQGEVYVWGYNKNGACGQTHLEDTGDGPRVLLPRRIPLPHFVTRLCCANGSEHMLAITSTGQLYGWGFNQYGQLGLGHQFEKILQPMRVEGALRDKRVTLAASSYSHSLALTSDGTLYGFGLNTRGQLGIGSTADMWTQPQRLAHLAEAGRALSMACGVEHSAVVMENGALYTFGRNDCGQLGIDDMTKHLSPLPVRVADGLSKLQSLRCEAVACGYYFTVVIADGTLHTFGKNEFGQLGVGHNYEVYAPVPVLWNGEDDRFVAVTCGTGHSVAATAYGKMIAWGRNKDGGLGNGTTVDHPFPVEICNKGDMSLSLRDQRPLHLAAGFHHTCILVGGRSKSAEAVYAAPSERISWPLRSLKAAVLTMTHYFSRTSAETVPAAAVQLATDWLLQRIQSTFGETQAEDRHGAAGASRDLCPRHNAADLSLCCLEERRDTAVTAWIDGIARTNRRSRRLFLNFLLQMLHDLVARWPATRRHLRDSRRWALDLLFDVGLTPGAPVRSSIAFDTLAQVLPCVGFGELRESVSLRELLLCVGRGDNLAVSAQVVALLRTLLSTDANGWKMCVNRALYNSLAAQIPRLPEDVEDLSVFDENHERTLMMLGALKVLGASDEEVYSGAAVSVVASDIDRQEGCVTWFRPRGGFQGVAQVRFESGAPVTIERQSELTPLPKVAVPVDAIDRPGRVLALLVNLVQQSVELAGSGASLQNAKAAALHEMAKARASKVVDAMLHNQPGMVQRFVKDGHLQAVTSLLAAPRGRLDDVPIRELQRRFLALDALRRKLDEASSAATPRSAQLKRKVAAEGAPSWLCDICSYNNPLFAKSCEMCFARGSSLSNAVVTKKPLALATAAAASENGTVSPASPAAATASEADDPAVAQPPGARKGPPLGALSRSLSSTSLRAGDIQSSHMDQLACSWSFEGGHLPDNKKIPVELKHADLEPGEEGKDVDSAEAPSMAEGKAFLSVPAASYLRFEHCFTGNGSQGSVYLNQYSLILDVRVPRSSMEHDFVAMLQSKTSNSSLADWYVKGTGAVGCIEYSEPGVIEPDRWYRLAMTADLTKGEICFFVDGERQARLVDQGPGRTVIEDDRWALDSAFFLFRDVEQLRDAPEVHIAHAQLRSYAMSENEVSRLGAFGASEGIPLPDVGELATRLSRDLKLPKAWCVRALQATQHRLPQARDWLRSNEQKLNARTVAEARMLTALGYSRQLCAHAICTTSSLSDAIHWLLDHEGVGEHDLSISRIMHECAKEEASTMLASDMLAINLAEDDQDAHNKTYEIYENTSGKADVALEASAAAAQEGGAPGDAVATLGTAAPQSAGARSGRLNLPPLGCGVRQINAELWETARQLFISHARQATVSILENSLVVQVRDAAVAVDAAAAAAAAADSGLEGADDSDGDALALSRAPASSLPQSDVVEDMQQKLLAVDGTGRNFLRNYLRAFPDSIRKDIRSGTVAQEVNPSDPIQVLRRKLLLVFSQEVEKRITVDNACVTISDALNAMLSQQRERFRTGDGKRLLEPGTRVWWIEADGGDREDAAIGAPEPGQELAPFVREGVVVSEEFDVPAAEGGASAASAETSAADGARASTSGAAPGKKKQLEQYQQQQEEFQQLAKVLYDFTPQRKGDLKICKGETVVVLGATKSGWGRAKDMKTGEVGTIPLNYVDAIAHESSDGTSEGSRGAAQNQQATGARGSNAEGTGHPERRVRVATRSAAKGAGDGAEAVAFPQPEELFAGRAPTSLADKRVVRAMRRAAEERAWRSSVLRSLSEDVLHELVLLARGPWQFLPGGLQAGPSVQFREMWSDKFTRTTDQVDPLTKKKKEVTTERAPTIRIWRPFADSGFSILGDIATGATGNAEADRPPAVTVVSDDDGMGGTTTTSAGERLLVEPLRYKLLWQNVDAEQDEPVSLWQPVPPKGYVSFGCVAVKGHSRKEPDPKREGLQQLRCVHESCVQLSTLQHGLWSYRPGDGKKGEETGARDSQNNENGANGEEANSVSTGGGVGSGRRRSSLLRKHKSHSSSSPSGGSAAISAETKAAKEHRLVGVSIWEIDNSSRTFVPVVAKPDQVMSAGVNAKERSREKSKLLSMNRVDAATIEARLCVESKKKSSDEDTRSRMLHGLRLTTGFAQHPPGARDAEAHASRGESGLDDVGGGGPGGAGFASGEMRQDELRPYHLGLASTTNSNHGSSELLLWILQLFSEFDSNEENGMGRWAKRVFSPQLVHALLRFSRTATPLVRIKAIRMLAMVIRRTPAASLRGKLGKELLELRVQMESLYKRQAQKPKDGLMDEMPLFSSLLCALAEVFVSVSLTQRQSLALSDDNDDDDGDEDEDTDTDEVSEKRKSGEKGASGSAAAAPKPHEYFEVSFDGPLGIEILFNKGLLIVHSVKPEGAANDKGVRPGDIFWELNAKRIADFERQEMWSTIKNERPLKVTFLRDNSGGSKQHGEPQASGSSGADLEASDKTAAAAGLAADTTSEAGAAAAVPRPATPPTAPGPVSPTAEVLSKARAAADGLAAHAHAHAHDAADDIDEDPLTSEENWFQQLSELAAIMEALVHRDRVQMPAEFLMAEDTFLKLVLANHTAVVETQHPFSSKLVKGMVTIPGAEALVVRFDRRCSTPFGKTLQLSCNAKISGQVRRDIHVETLQGCFGGSSVHVPSSTMTYQFPVPQTMNWGFHRTADYKAPEIRVSNNGRTASLRKDKVWQTVFSTTGFNSGINMWEVRVDRTGPSANIFFGVAMKSAKVTNYLGSDDKGWGWIGCMACWHGGRKVRHRFGKRLKQGDIVRVTLDIPRRAMSIACNGEDWGVAFNRLPLPSTVLKPGNELVPTFSFYNKEDQITLLSGSTAIDLETAGVLHQLRSNFEQQHATARMAPRTTGSNERDRRSSGGRSSSRRSSSRHRDSDSERTSRRSSRRSLARPRTSRRRMAEAERSSSGGSGVSGSGMASTEAGSGISGESAQMQEQAQILSALGYPVEWCVQALNATDHDMQRAADYLINHSERMAEESKQEAERAAVEAEEAVIAEEEEWLNQVNLVLDLDQPELAAEAEAAGREDGDGTGASAAMNALKTAASVTDRIVQREYPVTSALHSDDESASGDTMPRSSNSSSSRSSSSSKRSPRDKKKGHNKEWGYRMTISPLFSRQMTKKIAMEPKNAQRLAVFHRMFATLTLEQDCDLVRMVNDICSKQGEDPLTLSPNDLEPSKEDLMRYKSLEGIPLLHLQLRFLLLRNFNRRLSHVLPLIDLSCPAHESALAAALRSVRGVVMSSVKKALFERVLADSHSGDDHWMQQNKVPTVTLDRNKAAQFLKTGRRDVKGTKTVFGQLFSQLHGTGTEEKVEKNPLLAPTPAVNDASLLRNSHRAWYTILAGERADDYGGPYRDVFNQACQELLTPALPLFVPCPNQVANQGSDRGKWLPSAAATSHISLRMYEFVGKLMGIAMRTKNPFVLDLPSFVWKQLCNDQCLVQDVHQFDLDFMESFRAVLNMAPDDLQRMDLKFTMKGSDGRVVELVPGGNSMAVTANRREDYLRALERARLHELDRQCAAIARGLGTQVPRNLLSIFTANELELMVCGPPEVDISILKMNTIYGDGVSETTPSVQLFWQVMEEFSQDDKQRYLRFVWGRSRLPGSTADWERKHKINKYSKTPSDDYLPVGHTCFFSLDLPMYTSKQVCHDKLLFAITHCIAIDADETTVARAAADGGWGRGDEDDDDDDEDDDDDLATGASSSASASATRRASDARETTAQTTASRTRRFLFSRD